MSRFRGCVVLESTATLREEKDVELQVGWGVHTMERRQNRRPEYYQRTKKNFWGWSPAGSPRGGGRASCSSACTAWWGAHVEICSTWYEENLQSSGTVSADTPPEGVEKRERCRLGILDQRESSTYSRRRCERTSIRRRRENRPLMEEMLLLSKLSVKLSVSRCRQECIISCLVWWLVCFCHQLFGPRLSSYLCQLGIKKFEGGARRELAAESGTGNL